jgi:hypothetical protein
MKHVKLALLSMACLALSALSVPSFAADPSGPQSMDNAISQGGACKADINQFCKDITSGEGRIAACLKSHEDKLSSGCKEQWTAMHQKMKETARVAKQACGTDMQKFCPQAVGLKEVHSCLNSHIDDLSPSCKSFQTSMNEKMKERATGGSSSDSP